MQRGVGFSHYLAAGNSCDVDVCDFVSYLAEDDDTKSIICLLEGVKDGDRFLTAARKARDAGKALIVYKTGNSETSSKAAMSHTGTMVGSVVAYRTAIEEARDAPGLGAAARADTPPPTLRQQTPFR